MAEKEARSSAAVPAAGERPSATRADILIVDDATSAQEQAEQELAAKAADERLQAPASPAGDWAGVRTDSPAAELAAELARPPDRSIMTEQIDEEEEGLSAQLMQEQLAEKPHNEEGTSEFKHNHDDDIVAADGTPPVGAHIEPLYAASTSFGRPSHAAAAAAAAEVTIMTQELLNEALHIEQMDYYEHPTDAREALEEGSAFGEAQGAAAGSSPEANGGIKNADAAAVQAVIESLLTTEADSAEAAHEAADMQPINAAMAEQGDTGAKEGSIAAGEQQTLANLALAGGAVAIDDITGYLSHDDAGDAAHAHAVAEDPLKTSVTLDRLISGTRVTKEMPQYASPAADEGTIGEEAGLTGHVSGGEQQGLLQSQSADAAENIEMPQDSHPSITPSPAAAEQPRTDSGADSANLGAMLPTGNNIELPVKSLVSTEEPQIAGRDSEVAYEDSIPPSTPALTSQLETGSLANTVPGEAEPALDTPADAAAAAAEEAEEAEAKISITLQPRLEWRVNAEITLQQPDGASPTPRDELVEELDVTSADLDDSAARMGLESSHDEGVDAANVQLSEEALEAQAAG